MKKLSYLLAPVLAFAVLATSCTKEDEPTPTPNPTPTPTAGPTPPSPTPGGDISGALISINMVYSSTPAGSPFPIELETEIGTAIFYSTPGGSTYVDAGAVSVNDNALEKQSNNTYTKIATTGMTPASLKFSTGSNWTVAGSSNVTGFSHSHATTFPKFTGTVPTTVTKSNGVTLTLNSSTVSGADSVYVLVAAGNTSVLKSFAANAGTVTISASDLSSLPNVSDNTALFEVCPFNYSFATKNGKKYVFIKEEAIVKNININ